jgi:phage terminase large subunit GpA-like protein
MLLEADQGPPRFAAAGPVVAAALAELRFPENISINGSTIKHRVLDNPGAFSGPWKDSPHDMRFTERAQEGLHQDSPYREVVIEGPTQTAKSEIGNNFQLHTVIYNPRDMLFVMPDRVSIDQYVKTQWNKMIDTARADVDDPESPLILKQRQLAGASADTINLKMFRGCSFFFSWPSGPTFRFKPISYARVDELDEIPQDIGAAAGGKDGQGDPLSLLLGRAGSFSMYGGVKIYVNSSPKLGPKRGIAALRAAGTNESWWVDCLQCGTPFELDTEHCLKFDETGTPLEAAASAVVVCRDPECGGFHRQQDKAALMATGRWVGRGETAVSRQHNPEGKVGELVPNSRLSQRWDGLMGFRRWSDMAEQWRTAELAYENNQDEGPLTTYFQTVIGKNYTPKGSGEPAVTEEELLRRAKAAGHRFRTVPREARCVVMAVDQAVNRFEVAAWAFGPGFRAWLVDRFEILVCGDEPLRPFTRPEHFAVLHEKVLSKRYPVAGAPQLLVKPIGTVLDTGGMDGATDNAFAWWGSMVTGDVGSGRKPVPHTAITLFKGGNRAGGKLLPPPTIDAKRQIKGAPQCELYIPNVSRLKDMADVGLRRDDGGPGSIVFPGDVDKHDELLAAPWIAEMKAEAKNAEGVWERPPNTPNETLDLYTMARTVLLRLGGVDHSLNWVPSWARPPRTRPAPAESTEAAEDAMREAQDRPPPPAPIVPARRMLQGRPRVRVVRAR